MGTVEVALRVCARAARAMSGQPNLDPGQAMTMAKEEVLYRVDLFNSMSASCFDKCMSKPHKESDLNVGGTLAWIAAWPSTGKWSRRWARCLGTTVSSRQEEANEVVNPLPFALESLPQCQDLDVAYMLAVYCF